MNLPSPAHLRLFLKIERLRKLLVGTTASESSIHREGRSVDERIKDAAADQLPRFDWRRETDELHRPVATRVCLHRSP